MDDLKFGTEDSRGHWRPKKIIKYAPVFKWPPKPKALFKWFFGFPGFFLPCPLCFSCYINLDLLDTTT